VERLVARSLGSGTVSLVLVEAASFGGREAARRPELLRLQAAGVSVAVVRHGDDLRERLSAAEASEAAHA
jgi:hypothetical protein